MGNIIIVCCRKTVILIVIWKIKIYILKKIREKYNLKWNTFIIILKKESQRIREKSTKNTIFNVLMKTKKLNLVSKNITKNFIMIIYFLCF